MMFRNNHLKVMSKIYVIGSVVLCKVGVYICAFQNYFSKKTLLR